MCGKWSLVRCCNAPYARQAPYAPIRLLQPPLLLFLPRPLLHLGTHLPHRQSSVTLALKCHASVVTGTALQPPAGLLMTYHILQMYV